MGRIAKIARRTFLIGSVAIAGGVAFGYYKYKQPYKNPLENDLADGEAALTPYVKVSAEGVTIYTPKSEMGQGVFTTMAALVAEELDIDLDQVTVEHSPAGFAYYNSAAAEEAVPFLPFDHSPMAEAVRGFMDVPGKMLLAMQITGGSSSVPDGFERYRTAGAAAREVLKMAAAEKLGVDVGTLKTARGEVIAADGTKVAYTELAGVAGGIEPPSDVKLRPQSEWRLLGKSLDRVDMVPKVTGTAEFGIDVRREGMLYATVRRNPRIGGAMNSYDASAAEKMPGVKMIAPIQNGVAVIATNTWLAIEAAKAVEFDWGDAPYPHDVEDHYALVESAFTEERQDSMNRDDGDVDEVIPAETPVKSYRAPYLAHAAMEPLNATVQVNADSAEIWVGTQNQTMTRKFVAEAAGVEEQSVKVHTSFLGGGFGRRGEIDFAQLAAEVAALMPGTPIKTTLSREEDQCQDFYRPTAAARIRVTAKDGAIHGLDMKCAAPATAAEAFARYGMPAMGPDLTIAQAAWEQPYMPAAYRATGYRADSMLPTGFWRSVGASQNAFFIESALDELAVENGLDPVEMRLKTIEHKPSRKVIEWVAEAASWGGDVAPGRARGMAFALSFGVPTAEIVEIENTEDGIMVRDVWVASDVGIALDPRNIEAQLISGFNFGLGAAMLNEITLDDGRVAETNFHTYEAMRMYQAPNIHAKALENGKVVRGIGEPGTPPAAPALANAIFALTGERLREMPFGKFVDFA
ncbi:MAG: molybdopterin cofactor-binding domain-containing protein [Pseudomonadota bacterium]